MIIRPYTPADLEPVARLFTASVHEVAASHYDAQQRAAWAPQPPDLAVWQKRLAPLTTLVAELVAEENSRLAGFLSYEDDGHIDLLYTAPGSTRTGVASRLYHEAETGLAEAGATELFTEASLVARPFFERQGFEVTEEQNVTRNGVSFRRFAMRKRLHSA